MNKNIQSEEMRFDNNTWLRKADEKVLIAGPCSAETEQQVVETSLAIAENYPDAIFRAGVWKPRTRPGTFEGVGTIALDWLRQVKKLSGLKVAIEVATTVHVEQALKAGVDVFWIGARTTGNPFHVQELAESLRGVQIPVFIKNPLHPDIQLWIGGIERFYRSGIKELGAIHRGFHAYENSGYRNVPRWQIVHSLKSMYPELPLICDISHIAGHRDALFAIAQQAYDLNLEGLMVETHNKPEEALSDREQQINPLELRNMLSSLHLRRVNFEDTTVMNLILELREQIDEIDRNLLTLLTKRMELVKQIGKIKLENNVSILQLQRWREIIDNCIDLGREQNLGEEFVKNVLIQIHDEAIRLQSNILKETKASIGNHHE